MDTLAAETSSFNPSLRHIQPQHEDRLAKSRLNPYDQYGELACKLHKLLQPLNRDAGLNFETNYGVILQIEDFLAFFKEGNKPGSITPNMIHAYFRILNGSQLACIFASVLMATKIANKAGGEVTIENLFNLPAKPFLANLRSFIPFQHSERHYVLLVLDHDHRTYKIYDSAGLDYNPYEDAIHEILLWVERNFYFRNEDSLWNQIPAKYNQVEKETGRRQSGPHVVRSTLRELVFNNVANAVCQESWAHIRIRMLMDIITGRIHSLQKPLYLSDFDPVKVKWNKWFNLTLLIANRPVSRPSRSYIHKTRVREAFSSIFGILEKLHRELDSDDDEDVVPKSATSDKPRLEPLHPVTEPDMDLLELSDDDRPLTPMAPMESEDDRAAATLEKILQETDNSDDEESVDEEDGREKLVTREEGVSEDETSGSDEEEVTKPSSPAKPAPSAKPSVKVSTHTAAKAAKMDRPDKCDKPDKPEMKEHPWEADSSLPPSVTKKLRPCLWTITSAENVELWEKEEQFETYQLTEETQFPICIGCGPISKAGINKHRVRMAVHPDLRSTSLHSHMKDHPMFSPHLNLSKDDQSKARALYFRFSMADVRKNKIPLKFKNSAANDKPPAKDQGTKVSPASTTKQNVAKESTKAKSLSMPVIKEGASTVSKQPAQRTPAASKASSQTSPKPNPTKRSSVTSTTVSTTNVRETPRRSPRKSTNDSPKSKRIRAEDWV